MSKQSTKTKPQTRTLARRAWKKPAQWQTPAVRARCTEAAEAAGLPMSAVDDAMASDRGIIRFGRDTGESLDWLVIGDESFRRLKPKTTAPPTVRASAVLDPVFIAIGDAKEAQRAWEAAMKVSGDLTGPAFDTAEAKTVQARKELTKRIRQLCVTVPTSDLGLVTFLEYLASQPREQKRIGLEFGLLDNKRLELAYVSVITGARRLLKLGGAS